MSIDDYFDKSITIRRLSEISGNKTAFQTVTVAQGHRQDLSEEERQIMDGATNKSYKIWCDIDENINEGDKLTIESTDYEVISKNQKDYGTNQHLEVICNQVDEGGQ